MAIGPLLFGRPLTALTAPTLLLYAILLAPLIGGRVIAVLWWISPKRLVSIDHPPDKLLLILVVGLEERRECILSFRTNAC